MEVWMMVAVAVAEQPLNAEDWVCFLKFLLLLDVLVPWDQFFPTLLMDCNTITQREGHTQ